MKKILTVAFLALLCTVLLLPVGAASWITTDTVSQMDEYPEWVDSAEVVEFEEFNEGTTDANTGDSGGFAYVFLKQKGLGDFSVPFKVEKSGTYNIGMRLMAWAKSVPRSTEFKIDDSEWIYLCYDYVDENQYSDQYVTGMTMYLEAGDHTVTLSLADDFDDSTVKSLYFDSFLYAFASEDKPAEAAPAPVEEAPATTASSDAPYAAFYPASDFELDAGTYIDLDTLEGSVNEKVLTCIASDNDATGDGCTFTFNVPETGKYTIWGRVYFPGQSNNSIHYSVDDGESLIWDFPDEDAADTACYSSWQYFYLTYRASDFYEDENLYGTYTLENNEWRHAPNVLDLTAGQHSIHFVGRETGWYLDEIIVTELDIEDYDPNVCDGNDAILEVCKFCGPEWQHYYKDVYAVTGVTAQQYFNETLYPVVAEEPAPVEEPVAEPVVEEEPAPVAEPEPEVVEVVEEPAPVVEPEPSPAPIAIVETAPQTFDFGVISAIAAILSLAGVAVSKKK